MGRKGILLLNCDISLSQLQGWLLQPPTPNHENSRDVLILTYLVFSGSPFKGLLCLHYYWLLRGRRYVSLSSCGIQFIVLSSFSFCKLNHEHFSTYIIM